MRYLRIFLLYFQHIFELRARSLVWFLIPIMNSSVMILFWKGAAESSKEIFPGWDFASFASYYLIGIIAGSLLMAHIEDDVSKEDIMQGQLAIYITKPMSYFYFKLFSELTPRIIQGFYGLIIILLVYFLIGNLLSIKLNPIQFSLSIFIWFFAFLISFIFKMIVGMISFWITEIGGLHELIEIIIIVFGGYIMPVFFLPDPINVISKFLPFAYMISYPIISIQGKLALSESVQVLFIQIFWILTLSLIYKFVWTKGIYKFTGVGQ